MSKLTKEFVDYIKSFNKQPGEFTRDEIYQIGLEHRKQLIKSWQEVAELVGWTKAPDSLRCYVKNILINSLFWGIGLASEVTLRVIVTSILGKGEALIEHCSIISPISADEMVVN